MKLDTQKQLAASILKCSEKRVRFLIDRLEDVSEAITKEDMRGLIKDGVVYKVQKKGISHVRANKRLVQRRKGRQKGHGSRKGKRTAREPRKLTWMNKVRAQRNHLKTLRENKEISGRDFRDLYAKSKGGFFRSKRHINLYIEENNMRVKNNG